MSYASASSNKPGAATAVSISGVQRLNTDLANVFERIESANQRVSNLANDFGTPENITPTSPSEGPVVTSNEHMGNIHRALSRLEQTISRIDNQ